MSRKCAICGKGAITGFNVSHSNRHTKRRWRPNIRSIRVRIGKNVERLKVCTSCISSGKIVKA